MSITIRHARPTDAADIAAVHVVSWQKIYRGHIPDEVLDHLSIEKRTQKWKDLIEKKTKIILILQNDIIVGFAGICASRDRDKDPAIYGEISALYLHPNVWKLGFGKKLFSAALSELENIGFKYAFLWVLKENQQARKFYESSGFTFTEQSKVESLSACTIGVVTGEAATENTIVHLNEVCYQKKLTEIRFESLNENHLDLITQWLSQPHVKSWWNDSLNLDELKIKYKNKINDPITFSFVFYIDDKPLGFIQYYYANKVGNGWWPNATEGLVGIDFYLGEKEYLNKGIGTKVIDKFTKKLFEKNDIITIFTDINPNNKIAKRCCEKVGFKLIQEAITPDGPADIMELKRINEEK